MSSSKKSLNVDLAKVYDAAKPKSVITILNWGDLVEVTGGAEEGRLPIRAVRYDKTPNGSILPTVVDAFLKIPKGRTEDDLVIDAADSKVMKVNFVDVQQGDGCVIETPKGQVILVDGGDNQMFARYLAARFRGTSDGAPKEIAAIVVTHGDADHFQGLTQIHASETNQAEKKRLFIHPARIYHNGIFKRPGKKPDGRNRTDVEMLNDTVTKGKKVYLIPLVEDLTTLADEDLNEPFDDWKKAIEAWRLRGKVEMRRLDFGMDDAFDFTLDESIKIQVLGPLTEVVDGGPALPFLGTPPEGPVLGLEDPDEPEEGFKGNSASHTINGHSIVLRLSYGGFSFLLTGDLNEQSERKLTRAHSEGKVDLTAEVLKAPHHGSADFSPAFLKAVAPMISVISSGDESEQKEYIHPRASLVGSLGRYSRGVEPLVFCTELVAFFKRVGWSFKDADQDSDSAAEEITLDGKTPRFYGFDRTAYGMVKIRTDGERLLVSANSGKDDMQEAYAYARDANGEPQPVAVRMV